jgi:SAM-dependent methyltransferase
MDFRLKSAAQHVFSVLPGGRRLNYWMQRYVTRTLPISDADIATYRSAADKHLGHYREAVGRNPMELLELGSGQHLCLAIVLGLAGCRVTATDIAPNARAELVEDIVRRTGAGTLQAAGVSYIAPYVAPPAASYDLVVSNDVLEHVPSSALDVLLAEVHRVLRPDGVFSSWINYQDHWARGDRGLSAHHFLRFSDARWRLYNPALQYQNRLRHRDFTDAFERAGFAVLSVEPRRAPPPDFPIAARFSRYSRDELAIVGAWFALRKR